MVLSPPNVLMPIVLFALGEDGSENEEDEDDEDDLDNEGIEILDVSVLM